MYAASYRNLFYLLAAFMITAACYGISVAVDRQAAPLIGPHRAIDRARDVSAVPPPPPVFYFSFFFVASAGGWLPLVQCLLVSWSIACLCRVDSII